jgi:nucleotide-binding universal stress UspA family protein
VEWAVEHRAELTFVHVVPLVDVVNGLGLEFPGIATLHEPTEPDRELLTEAARIAAEQGVAATTALLAGTTADEIVAHGEASGPDLIVVGSRGHGPVSDALLGSVSHAVLRHARCRVLVVRGARTS